LPIFTRFTNVALKALPVGLTSRHALPVRIFSPRGTATSRTFALIFAIGESYHVNRPSRIQTPRVRQGRR
jgi:hypothetical protein